MRYTRAGRASARPPLPALPTVQGFRGSGAQSAFAPQPTGDGGSVRMLRDVLNHRWLRCEAVHGRTSKPPHPARRRPNAGRACRDPLIALPTGSGVSRLRRSERLRTSTSGGGFRSGCCATSSTTADTGVDPRRAATYVRSSLSRPTHRPADGSGVSRLRRSERLRTSTRRRWQRVGCCRARPSLDTHRHHAGR